MHELNLVPGAYKKDAYMNKYISVMCLEYFNAVPFHATRYSLNVSTWKRDPVWSIAFRRKSTSRLAFLTVSDGCWLYIYFLFADPIDSHTRLQYSLCTLRRKSVYHSESISCRRFDDLSVKRIIGEYSGCFGFLNELNSDPPSFPIRYVPRKPQ